MKQLSPRSKRGDGYLLDMCVLSEREITRVEVILHARVVGGLQMVDGGEADDTIIGVLVNDFIWGEARDVSELPRVLIERWKKFLSISNARRGIFDLTNSPEIDIVQAA